MLIDSSFFVAVAVLQDTSRFLLTIGVGLFVAYLVLIITANAVGFAHRNITTVLQRKNSRNLPSPQIVHAPQVSLVEDRRVLESDAL